MINTSGYIKSFRKILNWEWFTDVNTCHFFLYCLLRANYDTQRFMGVEIPRGSFVSSLESMSMETGLTIQNIRTCIKKLETSQNIKSTPTNKFTIINVVNYEVYQDEKIETNKRLTSTFGLHKKIDEKINMQTNKQITRCNADEYSDTGFDVDEINTQTNKQLTNDQQTTNNNKRNIRNKEIKNYILYGEFQNVKLTDEEKNKLLEEFGNDGFNQIVKILDTYKGSTGRKYKSDYIAIRNWVIDRYKQDMKKKGNDISFMDL